MISETQYLEIKSRLAILDAWIDGRRGRNGWASYKPEELTAAGIANVTNEERSAVEVYEFCKNPPEKYTVYIKIGPDGLGVRTGGIGLATTWMGDKLGDVRFGRQWTDNFRGKRVSLKLYAINGKLYHGTYYKSSGDYARIRLAGHQ